MNTLEIENTSAPFLSVIIPVYNSENYVQKAVESVTSQSDGDWELIIVNDGSTDGSERIITRLVDEHKDKKIIYIQSENRGPSSARNIGINAASGRYVCFLDSDDQYNRNLFRSLKAISEEYDICYFGWIEIDEKDGKVLSKYSERYGFINDVEDGISFAKKKYLRKQWICNCNAIYKRKLIEEYQITYPEGIYDGEDACFIYKALIHARRVICLPEDYFVNIYREDSLMHASFSTKNMTLIPAAHELVQYGEQHVIDIELKNMLESNYMDGIITVAKRMAVSYKWTEIMQFISSVHRNLPDINGRVDAKWISKKTYFMILLYKCCLPLFFLTCKTYYTFIISNRAFGKNNS